MSDHAHTHSHTSKNIKLAFFLNLAFTIFEILGGFYTNSMAIIADAIHDIGDCFALGLAWYFEGISSKQGDAQYSYGYRRFSLLGAVISTIILVTGTFFVLSESVPRLIHPEHANAEGILLFAIVGVLVNGAAVLRLKSDKGINARVVAWHLIEDVLGWVAILIMSLILMVKDIPILDPILSILITLYVLYNVVRNLKKAVSIFLQAVPEDISIATIESAIKAITFVQDVHHTHIWSIDGEHHVITMHVVVAEAVDRDALIAIKQQIAQAIDKYDFYHSTIEIEFADEVCRMAKQSPSL